MTQEEKQLLLKDLCARLPYDVQCEVGGLKYGPYIFGGGPHDIEDLMEGRVFKPYLRPMSSMTEEEREYLQHHVNDDFVDYCNEHHFDYRGLIPMGLALEAPEGMYKTE